jgi:hypothetical protein
MVQTPDRSDVGDADAPRAPVIATMLTNAITTMQRNAISVGPTDR